MRVDLCKLSNPCVPGYTLADAKNPASECVCDNTAQWCCKPTDVAGLSYAPVKGNGQACAAQNKDWEERTASGKFYCNCELKPAPKQTTAPPTVGPTVPGQSVPPVQSLPPVSDPPVEDTPPGRRDQVTTPAATKGDIPVTYKQPDECAVKSCPKVIVKPPPPSDTIPPGQPCAGKNCGTGSCDAATSLCVCPTEPTPSGTGRIVWSGDSCELGTVVLDKIRCSDFTVCTSCENAVDTDGARCGWCGGSCGLIGEAGCGGSCSAGAISFAPTSCPDNCNNNTGDGICVNGTVCVCASGVTGM